MAKGRAYSQMLKKAPIEIYTIPADVLNDYICIRKDNVHGGIEREIQSVNVARLAGGIKTCMLERETLRKDRPPVLFYLTQSDRIKCSDEEKMEMLKRFIKEYNFFHYAEKNGRKVLGCHSTLGRNPELSENNRILSGFAPRGFEIPLLLAAGYHRAEEIREQVRELNWSIALKKSVSPVVFPFVGLSRPDSGKNKIEELERRREELLKISKEMAAYMEGLGKGFVFYLNGKGEEESIRKFFL